MTRRLDRAGPAALLARPSVRAALAALDMPGEESRLVGGCVRDALLGVAAADIDLATTHLPEAVLRAGLAAGLKAVPTGIEHGTITLVSGGEPIEVTTLREDVETDGRHAVVRFGRDFSRDAERRDFTINALSLGPDGTLHDTVGGVADLEARRVRFIGDAATRIREDALRILRFFRFHARFGLDGAPDPDALAACIAARNTLDGLSKERVRSEFMKLLLAEHGVSVVGLLSATGLLQRITGGVGEVGRLARSARAGQDAAWRLASLAVHAEPDAERLQERLRLSKAEAATLGAYARALAALHGRDGIERAQARALAAQHGATTLEHTLAVLAGEPRPALTPEASGEIVRLCARGSDPLFPLVGADLVREGIPPGRAIGQGLARARAEWLAAGCPEDEASRAALLETATAVARATAGGHT
ncbi:CCA tRNA nucleotidyltransferase [Methylobacterium aerolatum]|uniref:tRNA nucleotidyltransferase/poly(A) polymerase n=1 Tax=Methylobacterium aerolatum TaxID=418708 RepID=A0ABU0HYI0_9HYPH|nr:CCA tRNA nucleotidyltransferase [Methylobacterium aerolatum]MDQ0447399.1 tRNA nucleotidyltransferase/poly(A) polymerase [Methylobacterium aerolatum]GJD34150.1 CCA-adding enzyme [Methylobacterium aerolatum]